MENWLCWTQALGCSTAAAVTVSSKIHSGQFKLKFLFFYQLKSQEPFGEERFNICCEDFVRDCESFPNAIGAAPSIFQKFWMKIFSIGKCWNFPYVVTLGKFNFFPVVVHCDLVSPSAMTSLHTTIIHFGILTAATPSGRSPDSPKKGSIFD